PTSRRTQPWQSTDLAQAFNHHGDSLPPTDTRRCDSIFLFATAQLVQEGDDQTGSGGTKRMPESNCTTVHIHLVAVEREIGFDREVLRGEGFVHLDEVDVI